MANIIELADFPLSKLCSSTFVGYFGKMVRKANYFPEKV